MNSKEWDLCAPNYHELIISPFQDGVKNPLYQELKNIPKNSTVADIGCGRGDLLPRLKGFKRVIAVDFSKEMLNYAKKKHNYRNVVFYKHDIRKLSQLNEVFNVAIAANSLLLPDLEDIRRSFSEIHGCIKKDGKFIGIFPSMESVIYNMHLIYAKEREKRGRKMAIKMAKQISERKKYKIVEGIYDDCGERQKFYTQMELKLHLSETGFKKIKIKKVRYPWGKHTGDYIDFPGKPRMWDWYVTSVRR